MKCLVKKFETAEALLEVLDDSCVLKVVATKLYTFQSGCTCTLKLSGKDSFYVAVWYFRGLGKGAYDSRDTEVLALDCGLSLEEALKDDPKYFVDAATGFWGIKDESDPLGYLWSKGGIESKMKKYIKDSFNLEKTIIKALTFGNTRIIIKV